MSELIGIKNQFQELQKQYQTHLPKVDPDLIDDLLLHQMENPSVTPMYLVEVFTKPGLNTQEVREYIISKTGMSPAIYDNGTHYVTNQKLTLEMLKEISDSEDVIEVTGEYTGGLGSYGASHEHGLHENHRHVQSTVLESGQSLEPEVMPMSGASADAGIAGQKKVNISLKSNNYRMAIYTAAGIVGAIALAGFIVSGGLPPNSNVGQAVPAGTEPAALHGYVGGPGGLPAVGATVVAAQQGTNFVASAFVSINGQYLLDVPAGEYVVVVAYPDGTDKVVTGLDVERGSDHELNFDY